MLAFFFSPSGRFGRAQWWLAQLAILAIVIIAVVVLMGILPGTTDQVPSADVLLLSTGLVIVSLMLFWIGFCVTVKRYHDRGKSAWWYLIQFIPIIGGIWALVELGFCSGNDGDNEYGDGPDLNIGEDLKALRDRNGQQGAVTSVSAYRPSPAPRTSGPPVFGKRV
jgi:uncharacterized membrane protein YhaH (DUF805 family)